MDFVYILKVVFITDFTCKHKKKNFQ